MLPDEVLKLVEADDVQGVIVLAVREWLRRYYPNSEYAVVMAELQVGVPMVQLPITPYVAA